MFTYDEYLEEAKSKPVVFTFGRFNPVTAGHEIMIKDVIKQAKSRGANPLIFTSQTQDKKKNPLSYKNKIKFLKHFWGKIIVKNTKIVTAFNALEWLSDKGYKNVTLVVGSDRVARFEKYMRPYVESYGFDHFEVVQAGVTRGAGNEMSASKMRQYATDGDFESYKKGMPSGADDSITKTIYDAVRDGLGIKEEALEFGTERTTKKYKSVTPGEAFGESIETFKEFEEAYVKPQKITLKSNGKSYTQNVRLRPGNTHIAIIHWKEIEATNFASGHKAQTEFISGTEKSLQKTVKHHLKNRGKYIEGGEILKIPEKYL
jgi:hypothetical protein